MSNQSKTVSMAMIILFLAFIVVYVVFYQIHGKALDRLFVGNTNSSVEWTKIKEDASLDPWSESLDISESLDAKDGTGDLWLEELLGVLYSNTSEWDATQDLEPIGSASTDTVPLMFPDGVKMLSGTEMFFGVVDAIDLLDLQPKYILKDYKDIYYARLEKYPLWIKSLVQLLWWTVYMMNTEKEILENQLFGERVTYINLPEYKNILVMMIVEFQNETRLLQIPYPKYHHSKEYLKTLFI